MRIKMDVDQVKLGMYIAELDRPWLESPFLFQGFVIDSEEDLKTLQEHCNYVFIDDVKSQDSEELRKLFDVVRKESDGKIPLKEDPRSQSSRESFSSNLDRASKTVERSRKGVIRFFNDIRLGKSIETEDAKAIVGELISEITYNTNTALWLTSLRSRNEASANHCLNVSILAIAFARHLGMPMERLQAIGLGALMHDIGLARVPDSILLKPGHLSKEEFEVIKKHPRDGSHVLKLTGQLPEEALDIVLHHHERLNGRGYPEQLSGDQIGQGVRIVAIADVYDSLTSDKPYRDAVAPQDALTMMHKRSEEDFGRQLMEEFIKCVGIYPIGSLVVLNTGALGVVVSSNPEARLKPLILLVRDENGKDVYPRKLVNLAVLGSHGAGHNWSVSRVVNPNDYGVDVSAIAADEMNLY